MPEMESASDTVNPQRGANNFIALKPYTLNLSGITLPESFLIPLDQIWSVRSDPLKFISQAFDPQRTLAGSLQAINHNTHEACHWPFRL
jgi:hypothetical protein